MQNRLSSHVCPFLNPSPFRPPCVILRQPIPCLSRRPVRSSSSSFSYSLPLAGIVCERVQPVGGFLRPYSRRRRIVSESGTGYLTSDSGDWSDTHVCLTSLRPSVQRCSRACCRSISRPSGVCREAPNHPYRLLPRQHQGVSRSARRGYQQQSATHSFEGCVTID